MFPKFSLKEKKHGSHEVHIAKCFPGTNFRRLKLNDTCVTFSAMRTVMARRCFKTFTLSAVVGQTLFNRSI